MNLILIYKIPTKYDTEYVRYNRIETLRGISSELSCVKPNAQITLYGV